jgi:MFS family permease
MALTAAAFLLLPLADSSWLLFALMVVAGFGAGILDPLTLSWIAGRVSPDLRGTAIGLRLTGNRLGQFVIPLLLGMIGSAGGIGAVFISAGAMIGASAALIASAPAEHFIEGPEGIERIVSE